jgi:hypothetical protein
MVESCKVDEPAEVADDQGADQRFGNIRRHKPRDLVGGDASKVVHRCFGPGWRHEHHPPGFTAASRERQARPQPG